MLISDYSAGPFVRQVTFACPPVLNMTTSSDQLSSEVPMGMAVGMPEVKGLPAAVDLAKNPLNETHEFRQACSLCYVKTGELF